MANHNRTSKLGRRLRLQQLEDRLTPAYTVLNLFNSGTGSLRWAVDQANNHPGADTIEFAPSLSGEIKLTTGEIDVTEDLVINGPGNQQVVIDGNNASRIFDVPSGLFTVTDLTLANGVTSGSGGAILCDDSLLTLNNCIIYNNTAQVQGGGVAALALDAINTTFLSNAATDSGGAIRALGFVDLIRCTVADNVAQVSGGLDLQHDCSIIHCTFSGNKALGSGFAGGGAITFHPTTTFSQELSITNTTISNNQAENGAGIFVVLNSPAPVTHKLVIEHSTIVDNFASNVGGGIGITRLIAISNCNLQLQNSIVASNTAISGLDICSNFGVTCSADYNIVGIGGDSSVFFTGSGNQIGTLAMPVQPMLSKLGNFGGPTQTHYPLYGSPAIDQGGVVFPVASDQRGMPRLFNGKLDIGAVEINPATWVVTRATDEYDGNLSAEDLSLREAVFLTNSTAAPDTITFSPAVFSSDKTITLATNVISIYGPLTITGPTTELTLDGDNNGRIFDTTTASAGAAIRLSNLTMTKGTTVSSGGAILAYDENLILNDCTFAHNKASNDGGAIFNSLGNLTATDCDFVDNSAGAYSGAIHIGTATSLPVTVLTRCTISGNTAQNVGAVYALWNLTIDSCTIASNSAANLSGAVHFNGFGPGPLMIRNSTISANSASAFGAVYISNGTGSFLVTNSTITGNTAITNGGGIVRSGSTGNLVIQSSIVSGNSAANGPDILAGGTVGVNNSAVGNQSGFALSGSNNLPFGADLKLAPLADNGGPTKTHRPSFSSPVIDKGNNPEALVIDQRGLPRVRGASADIGAFETPPPILVTTDADNGAGSLRAAIVAANNPLDVDQITFDPIFFSSPRQIKLLTPLPAIVDSADFIGTSAANVTVTRDPSAPDFGLINCQVFGIGVGTVSFSGMTFTGGKSGGGIFAGDDDVTITDCVLANNSATSGGGISVGFIGGVITILNSTISGNTAVQGGGINLDGTGSLLMENCTVSGNTATGILGGGGLRANAATIRNSTFSGNIASTGRGGAIVTLSNATLQNCTVVNNSANTSGGGIHRQGGTLSIESTIVAKNSAVTTGKDIHSSATVLANFSLIGIANDGPVYSGANNKTGTTASPLDPLLGPLQNNGGPTLTHALLTGSPCFGAGNNPAGLIVDQRGVGFPRVVGGAADIGAFEDELGLVVLNANDSGKGSLRQAILNANANPGPDTVTFDSTFFTTAKTILLTTGELTVSQTVTITGPGAALMTVSGNKASRVFNIGNGFAMNINMSGLTISGGITTGNGGGILVQDTGDKLTLIDCVVSGNSAVAGGAIFFEAPGGSLTLDHCMLDQNVATGGSGGGVHLVGSFYGGSPVGTIRDTTISGSTASVSGGGIFNAYNGNLLLERSTLSGNKATTGIGGGLFFYGLAEGGPLVVRNCTISGNSAGDSGGGIGLKSFSGTLTVQNSTMTANTATTGKGGGIARFSGAGAIVVESSIVSGNTNTAAPDISSIVGTVTVNFSAIGSSNGFTLTGSNNLPFGTNLKLGPLVNNGGPTKTHALLTGSPAINAGNNSVMLLTDQRGTGFGRSFNGTDIGAFEVQQAPPAKVISAGITGAPVQRSRVTEVKVEFDQIVALPASPATAFQLKRQSDDELVDLTATVDNMGPGTVVAFTFNGALSESGSLADGRYTLIVLAPLVNAGNFDGNSDGMAGDNYEFLSTGTAGIFRLFGDADGNGTATAADFNAFRLAYGTSGASIFDFDNNGQVSAADFNAFRLRYGVSL